MSSTTSISSISEAESVELEVDNFGLQDCTISYKASTQPEKALPTKETRKTTLKAIKKNVRIFAIT